MLSRDAQERADEIRLHDWSDAPWRIDRAGHSRASDSKSKLTTKVLSVNETDNVRWNVVLVTAQPFINSDPNFKLTEFAIACGLPPSMTGTLTNPNGGLDAGIRRNVDRHVAKPGSWD